MIKAANHKKRIGKVASKKTAKTAIVKIERLVKHPYYGKRYRLHKRIACHDEKDLAKKGDMVVIQECKPISKTKRWEIVEIIK